VGAHVVFLLHDDTASLHFDAVRAILDWGGQGEGTRRAIHVMPLASVASCLGTRRAPDLLDLVEETSMARKTHSMSAAEITSSSQFWNREERLVSGLLAEDAGGGAGPW